MYSFGNIWIVFFLISVLRLGRFLDSLYSALKTVKYPDLTLRVTLTLSKIANALFLLTDHIIWMGRVGVMRINLEKWSKIANKYWLMTIVMNLSRDIYEIVKILEREGPGFLSKKSKISTCSNSIKQYQRFLCLKERKDVVMDAVRNGCDLFIPLTALGFTNLTPGTIGMCGVISSAIGIYTLIYPFYKLTPS